MQIYIRPRAEHVADLDAYLKALDCGCSSLLTDLMTEIKAEQHSIQIGVAGRSVFCPLLVAGSRVYALGLSVQSVGPMLLHSILEEVAIALSSRYDPDNEYDFAIKVGTLEHPHDNGYIQVLRAV